MMKKTVRPGLNSVFQNHLKRFKLLSLQTQGICLGGNRAKPALGQLRWELSEQPALLAHTIRLQKKKNDSFALYNSE